MLPVEEWRSYEVRDKTGVLFSCNMIEQLCNKGWGTLTEDAVTIPNRYMAKCQPWELAALALPPALPFHVRIHPRGSLTMGSKFAVEYAFHSLSQPVSFTRTGIMVKAEGKEGETIDDGNLRQNLAEYFNDLMVIREDASDIAAKSAMSMALCSIRLSPGRDLTVTAGPAICPSRCIRVRRDPAAVMRLMLSLTLATGNLRNRATTSADTARSRGRMRNPRVINCLLRR